MKTILRTLGIGGSKSTRPEGDIFVRLHAAQAEPVWIDYTREEAEAVRDALSELLLQGAETRGIIDPEDLRENPSGSRLGLLSITVSAGHRRTQITLNLSNYEASEDFPEATEILSEQAINAIRHWLEGDE